MLQAVNSETYPLFEQMPQTVMTSTSPSRFIVGMGICKAFLDGIAKTYATWGKIAIYSGAPGLWLLAPVLIGGGVSAGEKIFSTLQTRSADQPQCVGECTRAIDIGARNTKFLNQTVVGFCEDFGFTWGMVINIAGQIGGLSYIEMDSPSKFSPVVAPLISIVPALIIRFAHYQHAYDEENHNIYLKLMARTLGAACSSTFIMEMLQEQGWIKENSSIPISFFIITGLAGLVGAWVEAKYPKNVIPEVIEKIIEFFFENLSLVVAFFAFPNDIMAAVNEDTIPDAFLYVNLGFTVIYGFLLAFMSCVKEPADLMTFMRWVEECKACKKTTDENSQENNTLPLNPEDFFSINGTEMRISMGNPGDAPGPNPTTPRMPPGLTKRVSLSPRAIPPFSPPVTPYQDAESLSPRVSFVATAGVESHARGAILEGETSNEEENRVQIDNGSDTSGEEKEHIL